MESYHPTNEVKNTMSKKNQITQANSSNSNIVELSDEDLQQIVGGGPAGLNIEAFGGAGTWRDR